MTKILLLCDDYWHPAEVIEKGVLPLLTEYDVEVVKDAKDILTPEMIARYPLIINLKGNNLTSGNHHSWFQENVTEVAGKEFREYVENGGVLLSAHAGNSFSDGGEMVEEMVALIGNRFLSHPDRCTVVLHKEKDHPIMAGIENDIFTRDEHYQLEIVDKMEDLDVFLTSTSASAPQQLAGYTKTVGKGKVCVLVPGHNLSVWENPDIQKMFLNAVKWCLE